MFTSFLRFFKIIRYASLEESFLPFSFIPAFAGRCFTLGYNTVYILFLWLLTREFNSRMQGKNQALAEFLYEELENLIITIVGEKHVKELLPVMSAVFIYIASANMLGLVPGFKAPTSIFSNCLGMALIIFFYTIYLGIKSHGLGYIKHFTGDIWWMAPIMLPIHLIGEISHPISLSLRLFGNIFGEEVVIAVLTTALFPLLLPIPMMLMGIFTSLLQALVFTILSGIYLSGAIDKGH